MNTEVIEIEVLPPAKLEISRSLIAQADDLAAEHESFHDRYILGGRVALYDLLGKIYELAQKLDDSCDKEDQISLMRVVLAEKYQIRTQENTPDLTVLVRYITRADRKTAHVYARAIEAAKSNKVSPLELPEYLEEQGGVERIRANSVEGVENGPSQESLEERVDLARRYLIARKEYPVTSFAVSKEQLAQLGGSSDLSILLCTESKGRYSVLGRVPLDNKFEKKIIDVFGKQLPDDLSEARKDVDRFYDKAMKKRHEKTMKEMIRQRPKVAEEMLRIQRIRVISENLKAGKRT